MILSKWFQQSASTDFSSFKGTNESFPKFTEYRLLFPCLQSETSKLFYNPSWAAELLVLKSFSWYWRNQGSCKRFLTSNFQMILLCRLTARSLTELQALVIGLIFFYFKTQEIIFWGQGVANGPNALNADASIASYTKLSSSCGFSKWNSHQIRQMFVIPSIE